MRSSFQTDEQEHAISAITVNSALNAIKREQRAQAAEGSVDKNA